MNNYKYFPGQEIVSDDLNGNTQYHILNLKNRFSTLISSGIFKASELASAMDDSIWNFYGDFDVTPSSDRDSSIGSYYVDVSAGIAISSLGEYIHIAPLQLPITTDDIYDASRPTASDNLGNLIPKSTGHLNIPITQGILNYIYIEYLEVVNTVSSSGDPENNYTVDPDTGDVNYIAYNDGYKITVTNDLTSMPSTAFYLATVDASTNVLDITRTDVKFAYINAANVRAKLPTSSTQLTDLIYPSNIVTLDQHIRSVANVDNVTPSNPHGLGISDIPGLISAIGPYSLYPSIYNDNGIVDKNKTIPGPLFATTEITTDTNIPTVKLTQLDVNQHINIGRESYVAGTPILSENYYSNSQTIVVEKGFEIKCDFPSNIRTNVGYYYICITLGTSTDGTITGLKVTPIYSGVVSKSDENLLDLIRYPENYIKDDVGNVILATHMPVAIVFFAATANPAVFSSFNDPQTGYTNLTSLDIRKFGTISYNNLLFEKRFYGTSAAEIYRTDTVFLKHNLDLLTFDITANNINIKTNADIGGNQTVAGNQTVEGNQTINGDQTVDGNLLGDQTILGNVEVGTQAAPKDIFVNTGMATAKKVLPMSVEHEYRATMGNSETITVIIAPNEAPNYIIINISAEIDCFFIDYGYAGRNIIFNSTPIGRLHTYGGADGSRGAGDTSVSMHRVLVAGVDYVVTDQNIVILDTAYAWANNGSASTSTQYAAVTALCY